MYLSRPRATEVPGVARPGQLLPILPGELEGKSSLGNKVDLTGIDIGTVVKAKGTVGEYFGEKQVLLERICTFAPFEIRVYDCPGLALRTILPFMPRRGD